MKKLFLTILWGTLCATMSAVPVNPAVLRALLEQGDTARYTRLLEASRTISSRRPQHSLIKMQQEAIATAPQRAAAEANATKLADRGLLILANFQDKSFLASNSPAEMDSMMNGRNYTYGSATGSAAQYYSDQSNGAYRPHFDVVGPIMLPQNIAYYGANGSLGEGGDAKSGDLVLHACSIASQIDGVNLKDYDHDNNGILDFVYIIFAGYTEAEGAAANTIWAASWDMATAVKEGYTSLSKRAPQSNYTFDGVTIGNYAYSSELKGSSGSRRTGIGTPTHEFGHVLGFPDFYDTTYGTNYNYAMTPDAWDLMDNGSYNNGGHTPPNLSPWEKAFLGWITPVNPGNTGDSITLYANGTEGYQVYQINQSGRYQTCQSTGVCYYVENRQQKGWDSFLPGHGMVIWKLDYNQQAWDNNAPNNTKNVCRYTVVSATSSTKDIGSSSDPFPGTQQVTSWSGISTKPLTDISEVANPTTATGAMVVTFNYMGGKPITALEDIRATTEQTQKVLHNGQLYLLREGHLYLPTGQLVR